MAELRYASSITRLALSSKHFTPSGTFGQVKTGQLMTDDERLEYNKIGVRNFIRERRARGIREDGTTPASVWS